MRYQTALNPDIKIGAGLNFYRHPHLNNRYSVTNVGNQYSQRSTVSWLMYAHPGAVFITKWISYGSLWHNLIVSFDTSTTLCHLGLDLDSNFQIVPWLDSLRGSNTYVRAYQYLLAFIKAQSSFWLSRYCALGRQTCSATMLGHHPKCNELGA